MSTVELSIQCISSAALSPAVSAEIRAMCRLAFKEDLDPFFESCGPAVHLIGRLGEHLASHVMWITRWLQPDGLAPLRTAYIEAVATHPATRGRGYATRLMQAVPERLGDFELAALCPADTSLYRRLGWTFWRGPLFIRRGQELLPTPEERVMIWSLPKTPQLDLDSALSAEWRPGEVW
jgi:aminoglycoside 2'-N-acetyltransferase I